MGKKDLNTNQDSKLVQSVARALDILDVMSKAEGSMSLADISKATNLNASTVHRLLFTLRAKNYIRQDNGNKEYSLDPQCARIGKAALGQLDIGRECADVVRVLARETDELVNVAILANNQAIYVATRLPATRLLRVFVQAGVSVPLHCTGVGKAMLAFQSREEIEYLIGKQDLPAFTPNTITNIYRIKEELDQVRQQGYAIDNEEREIGVRCLAAPIFRGDGAVVAAVSVSGPPSRLSVERESTFIPLVKTAAAEISARLGFREQQQEKPANTE
jgi:DNA-binding IclR family transcriptional regulator